MTKEMRVELIRSLEESVSKFENIIDAIDNEKEELNQCILKIVFDYIKETFSDARFTKLIENRPTPGPLEISDLTLGTWDCPESPTQQCVYYDAGELICIFCGEPSERS